MRPLLLAVAAVLLVAACGTESGGTVDDPATEPTAPTTSGLLGTRYPVTVLDDGDGAELCLGGVMESLPPQCGGPAIPNWVWADHEGDFEAAGGVRWGDFAVTGTYDGTTFTVTDAVPAAEWDEPPGDVDDDRFATPCPEPDGGWVVDPARTGYDDFNRIVGQATKVDGYADSWVDTSRDERSPEDIDQELAAGHDDVSLWVLNVRVVGDPAAAAAELRDLWGGGLCVTSGVQHTQAELLRIQREANELPGMVSSGASDDHVEVQVIHDDGSLQELADQRWGPGVVQVSSALVPVD